MRSKLKPYPTKYKTFFDFQKKRKENGKLN